MSITIARLKTGQTGSRHLNLIIARIETALNGVFTGTLPIATSDVTGLDAALAPIALKAPLASPAFTGIATVAALKGALQALAGPGAVDVVTVTTRLTTTGVADALTLADGAPGQIKNIVHEVDGGSAVLTPTTKTGFTTITFTAAGDSVALQFFATRGWMIISLYGAVAA